MNTSTYKKLCDLSTPEQDYRCRKAISTQEKGVTYAANIKDGDKRNSAVFKVDGGLSTQTSGCKCDKLIVVDRSIGSSNLLACFIELKGSDINHAITQLEATISDPLFACKGPTKARIVASRFPSNSGNTNLERAKIRFLTKYKCELRGLKSRQPDTL